MINPNAFPGGGWMTQPQSPMVATSSSTEGSEKKVRKPYTITKSREIWTDEEHDKFLEALQLFDRDWKKIEAFVASKTVIQIRSHAQKYFLKVQKNGTLAHVPPPRPKRKASLPYPQQKEPNSGLISLPTSFQYHSSVSTLMPGYASWASKALLLQDNYTALHRAEADDIGSKGVGRLNSNSISNLKTIGRALSSLEVPKQGQQLQMIRGGIPDFPEVYSFLGNLFDPIEDGHGDKLKEMDPITYQTVLLLMNNIASNLCDPVCEPHANEGHMVICCDYSNRGSHRQDSDNACLEFPLETEWSSGRLAKRVCDSGR